METTVRMSWPQKLQGNVEAGGQAATSSGCCTASCGAGGWMWKGDLKGGQGGERGHGRWALDSQPRLDCPRTSASRYYAARFPRAACPPAARRAFPQVGLLDTDARQAAAAGVDTMDMDQINAHCAGLTLVHRRVHAARLLCTGDLRRRKSRAANGFRTGWAALQQTAAAGSSPSDLGRSWPSGATERGGTAQRLGRREAPVACAMAGPVRL